MYQSQIPEYTWQNITQTIAVQYTPMIHAQHMNNLRNSIHPPEPF